MIAHSGAVALNTDIRRTCKILTFRCRRCTIPFPSGARTQSSGRIRKTEANGIRVKGPVAKLRWSGEPERSVPIVRTSVQSARLI